MLTPKKFLVKLKEKRGIDLSYFNLLNSLRKGLIKSKPHNVGARKGYLIPEIEIDNLKTKTIMSS